VWRTAPPRIFLSFGRATPLYEIWTVCNHRSLRYKHSPGWGRSLFRVLETLLPPILIPLGRPLFEPPFPVFEVGLGTFLASFPRISVRRGPTGPSTLDKTFPTMSSLPRRPPFFLTKDVLSPILFSRIGVHVRSRLFPPTGGSPQASPRQSSIPFRDKVTNILWTPPRHFFPRRSPSPLELAPMTENSMPRREVCFPAANFPWFLGSQRQV